MVSRSPLGRRALRFHSQLPPHCRRLLISPLARALALAASFGAASCGAATCSAAEESRRGAAEPSTPAAIYGQGVRETAWLSPQDEAAGFHLPDGFVAELVASEPQISKPLNMAFDPQGRLWITDTLEYPYPAPADRPPRDSIKVLSDTNGDGQFDSVATFADELNIPIGILPVADGVLCFSIPNLLLLRDTNGDGRADERKVILGPFDTSRDTHGMVNALRRGDDGWIYACHGFNNQSHVTAADGSSVSMISGNTFRFREDGSRIEHFTFGQVNPFGMTADDWGNWFTADCHSKPVTLLLQHGSYESFGRPHDGLGFVPPLMDHLHGSTAICGINYYLAGQYPEFFRERFYSGNVMTSRINTNRLELTRDTIRLVEEQDFMTSDDPWFRPVDVQLGPDGALYVADFYNKIIGHYEVPLTHPERDRDSGRIWRIRYTGPDAVAPAAGGQRSSLSTNATLLSPEHLADLASDNATRRQLALEAFTPGLQLSSAQRSQLQDLLLHGESPATLRTSALWALHRTGALTLEAMAQVLPQASPKLQAAALRAWQAQPRSDAPTASTAALLQTSRELLATDQPQLLLAVAAALGQHGTAAEIRPLLQQLDARSDNSVAQHALKLAVRALLRHSPIADAVLADWKLSPGNPPAATPPTTPGTDTPSTSSPAEVAIAAHDPLAVRLAQILPAVAGESAAEALLVFARNHPAATPELRAAAAQQAARSANERLALAVVEVLRQSGGDTSRQIGLVRDTVAALRNQRRMIPAELIELVEGQVEQEAAAALSALSGRGKPVEWRESSNRPWQRERRARTGSDDAQFTSSLTLGEAYTGVLSSSAFAAPDHLTFWIVGHDGPPSDPAQGLNYVRLVEADSGRVLHQAAPPRSDTARAVDWDLRELAGRPVRVEVIDGDAGNAYAWLGVTGFSDDRLNPSPASARLANLTQWIALGITRGASHRVEAVLNTPQLADPARVELVIACASNDGMALSQALAQSAKQFALPTLASAELVANSETAQQAAQTTTAVAIAQQLSLPQQMLFARNLISSLAGRQLLIQLVDEGRMALGSLRGLAELLGSKSDEAATTRLLELSSAAAAEPSDAEQQIVRRIEAIRLEHGDLARGQAAFTKHCANCHKLAGTGQLIGPQLDGVRSRGAQRLGEDILLPSRNVDKAFRVSSLLTEDEKVIVGLVRELNDGTLEVIGSDGKSQMIDPQTIAVRRDTTRSLMPENFAELLSDEELASLIRFIADSQPQE
jgi:putative heme-binding domain-containing protein